MGTSGGGGWGAVLLSGVVAATPTTDRQLFEVTRGSGALFGCGSPDIAEAEALYHALRLAYKVLPDPAGTHRCVHGDCPIVFRALHGLLPRCARLCKILRASMRVGAAFRSLTADWVPRADNAAADHAAGRASHRK